MPSYTLTITAKGASGTKTLQTTNFVINAPTFGATVNVPAGTYRNCLGGRLDPCSNASFDSCISAGLPTSIKVAQKLQKVYLNPGELPSTPPTSWKNFIKSGGQLLVSFRPAQDGSQVDAFQTCVQGCYAAMGNHWKGILWQEPNTSKSGFGVTQYTAYCETYGPIFRAAAPGIRLCYDPAVCGTGDTCNVDSAVAMYPGDQWADEIYADFYQTAYRRGGRLAPLAQLADRHTPNPIPFGLAEWGPAASPWTWDATEWNSYITYLGSFFNNRSSMGLLNGWMIWWSGNVGNSSIDWITDPTSNYIPGFQQLYQQLS